MWFLILADFQLTFVFIPGCKNEAADYFSRAFTKTKPKNILALSLEKPPTVGTLEKLMQSLYAGKLNFDAINPTIIGRRQMEEKEAGLSRYDKAVEKTIIDSTTLLLTKDGRVILPESLEETLLYFIHKILIHPGETKTFDSLKRFIYFPQMKTKINIVIKLCLICQTKKDTQTKYGMLTGYLSVKEPFEVVSSDIFGPLPKHLFKLQNNGYIITFIDFLMKTTRLKFLERIRGEEVVSSFKEVWLQNFPTPNFLHTNNGVQYTSEVFSDFCKSKGIQRSFSLPFNPFANSISERMNPFIKYSLWVLRGEDIKQAVQKIERGFNIGVHHTNKFSPIEIIGGFSPFDPLRRTQTPSIEAIQQLIEKTGSQGLHKRNRYRVKTIIYKSGDFCFVKNGDTQKFADPWLGPY